MAKEHSFDINAKIDMGELKNALEQAKKEITNRYDFKGLTAQIDFNETSKIITLLASSDNKAQAMKDVLISKCIKRSIEPSALKELKTESVGAGNTKLSMQIIDTLSSEDAKKITKEIKNKKLKVNATIRGDEVRVSAKSIDDLQECIAMIKSMDIQASLNFTNFL